MEYHDFFEILNNKKYFFLIIFTKRKMEYLFLITFGFGEFQPALG